MCRKNVFAVVLFLGASIAGFSQKVIENPAKAQNPNAGRVVAVEGVVRIEDTGEDYYFKSVYEIQVTPGGVIFVRSGFDQVLQFDPQGLFIRNLVKKGEGPGEVTGVSDVFVTSDRVYMTASRRKALAFDLDGRLQEEISLQKAGGPVVRVLAAEPGTIFAQRENSPKEPGRAMVPEDILAVSKGGEDIRLAGSFPLPYWILATDTGGWAQGRDASLLAVHFKDRQFFLTHTSEYLIKLFDAGTGKVVRQFKRDYPRIKGKDQGPTKHPAGFTWTPPKYVSDINDLHLVDGRLWVQTSAFDPQRGILFDVFTPEGRFVDSFYLKFAGKLDERWGAGKKFTFSGGFVYFSDTTEDGLTVIRKCRVPL